MFFVFRNILLSKKDVVKICDMGGSKQTNDTANASTFQGTTWYMSPEQFRCLISSKQKYSYNTDIW